MNTLGRKRTKEKQNPGFFFFCFVFVVQGFVGINVQ